MLKILARSLFIILLTPNYSAATPDYKNKDIISSPFNWVVIIDNKTYRDSEINNIKKGFKINNNKTDCILEFNSEWDTKSFFAKKYGKSYDERLWLRCKIGDTKIAPSAVSCTKRKDKELDDDFLSIDIGSSNILIRCGTH